MAWLGITSNLFVNSDAYNSPDFTAIDLVADAQLGDTWDEGAADARDALVHQFEPTQLSLDYTGNVRFKPDDAGYILLRNAHISTDALDFLLLNGPIDREGAEGYRFFGKVFGFNEDQGMSVVLYKAFTIKPCPGDEKPKAAKVVDGEVAFSEIGATIGS